MDCFKQNYSDQTDLMCEVLKHWLDTTTDPPPTWEVVITALRSLTVNKKKVADQLESKYCAPVRCMGEKSTKVEKNKGIYT